MKYNEKNIPKQCILLDSTCYKKSTVMPVRGILIHSTGANNPNLKRYVQPSNSNSNYYEMIGLLGKNTAGNDWNHITVQAGVNAFIGKTANGNVTSIQTLPWDMKPWGCGQGANGSCNNGWIQFEICEDGLTDKSYFTKVYNEAIELIAYLCKKYNLNPKGTVKYNGINVPVILCHQDSYKLGLGSNHSDVYNWFSKFGKNMNDIRNDVYDLLKEEVEEEMTQEQFNDMMNNYLAELAKKSSDSWANDAINWAKTNSIMSGDASGNVMPQKFITRQEMAVLLKRYHEKF